MTYEAKMIFDDDVITLMKRGIAQWAGKDGTGMVPYASTLLIQALIEEGDTEAALATLDGALEMAERIGERVSLPELYRLRGEALAQRDPEAARKSLRHAITIADQAGAAHLAMRAWESLSRMTPVVR